MRQRVFDAVDGPAKSDDSYPCSIDDPQTVQVVDGAFENAHLPRSFLWSSLCLSIQTLFFGVPQLQHDDVPCRQGLGCKRAVPRAIDPKFILRESVRLYHQRIPRSRFIVWGIVEAAFHLMAVLCAPRNTFHFPKFKFLELGIQIKNELLLQMCWVAGENLRW